MDDARAASTRVSALVGRARDAGEELFARNIEILDLELRAWLAHAAGAQDSAVALMRRPVHLEISTPKHAVTPAPTLPASELLGDLLLEQGHAAEAVDAYRESLEHYPARFNSLLGAARAARRAGDATAAGRLYRKLVDVADPKSVRPGIGEARDFIVGR
jgi:tetratricopeptide (TPR) repeat protein